MVHRSIAHLQPVETRAWVREVPQLGTRQDARRPKISLVSPCYNEEAVLPELYRRCAAVLKQVASDDFEIVLVNDGSQDATWSLICAYASQDPHVVGINLSRHFGHQQALSAGLEIARGELVFIIDADLQDPPELLPEMVRLVDHGADVVYGQRVTRGSETWFKRGSAALFYRLLSRIADVQIPEDAGDFRLLRREVVEALRRMPEHHRCIRGMVAWIGFKQVPLPYHREPRFAASSKYPLRKMVRLALDTITSFSMLPLRLVTVCGLLFSVVAFAALGYALHSWWRVGGSAGWASLVALVAILGGIQLLCLAVMSEYLGRVCQEVKGRPSFVIRSIVTCNAYADDADPEHDERAAVQSS